MASLASTGPLPALSTHEREEVGRELQATLVELIDLSLIGKQLHWTVVGPHFRPLHLQLDEVVDSWRDLGDTVAERAVALGFVLQDHVVVRELTTRIAETSERVRDRMNRLGELDLASQDVLVEVVRALEEQQWMFRAQLGKGS